ncbi:MAG TPA: SUMF1/EgtB/PvdO family nonheme iron enzyme [Anaerolineales bacterium]|nr:SUMF1/EgtB/PvdO family nonheme iron enzyme [Anaerolineales bacterium]
MKRLIVMTFVTVLLSGCARSTTPTPVPTQTSVPTATPVKINPPSVQQGASYLYADGTTLVAVPSGSFTMGDPKGKDNPQHQVTVGNFWIYSTMVTNTQYKFCFDVGYCTAPDESDNPDFGDPLIGNEPVVGVTYDQAASYCKFVNARLPTEAEWEKAARGPNGNVYPWGNDKPTCELLNFGRCVRELTPVNQYPTGRSYYGAFDMEGNALEWVADWYGANYYGASPSNDPLGPENGDQRVIRSAAFDTDAYLLDSARRSSADPATHTNELSFRCAVDDYALTYFAPYCQSVSAITDASSVTSVCPKLSITTQESCKTHSTYVTFNDDHPGDPNGAVGGVANCTSISGGPGSYPQSYQCTSQTTAVMNSSCVFTGIENAACAAHYLLDPATGLCKWDGSVSYGNQCLPAYNYDPRNKCCSVVPGTGVSYPACPAGTSFTEDTPKHYVCLPDSVPSSVAQQSAEVDPSKACTIQGVVNTCKLNSIICNQTFDAFCPTLCTCLPTGFKCPTH